MVSCLQDLRSTSLAEDKLETARGLYVRKDLNVMLGVSAAMATKASDCIVEHTLPFKELLK